jgi:hypothetical protein
LRQALDTSDEGRGPVISGRLTPDIDRNGLVTGQIWRLALQTDVQADPDRRNERLAQGLSMTQG